MNQHEGRSPEVGQVLNLLSKRGVRYVLNGSVATLVFGVDLMPGDIDIVPALDRDNLQRLIDVLNEIEALPPPESFGRWETEPDGERKWKPVPDPVAARDAWRPDAGDPGSLDHLFHTRLGNVDVVPRLTGTYDALLPLTVRWEHDGVMVDVVRPEILLETLTVPRREKDRPRVAGLREVQRRLLLSEWNQATRQTDR